MSNSKMANTPSTTAVHTNKAVAGTTITASGREVDTFHPPLVGDVMAVRGNNDSFSADGANLYFISKSSSESVGIVVTTRNSCQGYNAHDSCTREKCRFFHLKVGDLASALPSRNPVKVGVVNPRHGKHQGLAKLLIYSDSEIVKLNGLKAEVVLQATKLRDARREQKAKEKAEKQALAAIHAEIEDDEPDEPDEPSPKRLCITGPTETTAGPTEPTTEANAPDAGEPVTDHEEQQESVTMAATNAALMKQMAQMQAMLAQFQAERDAALAARPAATQPMADVDTAAAQPMADATTAQATAPAEGDGGVEGGDGHSPITSTTYPLEHDVSAAAPGDEGDEGEEVVVQDRGHEED